MGGGGGGGLAGWMRVTGTIGIFVKMPAVPLTIVCTGVLVAIVGTVVNKFPPMLCSV